jgi:NTE family protein
MDLWTASSSLGFFKRDAHDVENKFDPKAVGLCLSGGGYRATLFHAGAIVRLNELGVLSRLSRISSVSGGSICAGILGMNWSRLTFDANGVATNLREVFVKPCLDATARTLDIRVSLAGFLPFVSAGNRLSHLYDRFIFNGFKLNALPKSPSFVFNATNLQSSGLIRFTRRYIADWRALWCENHQVSLADAVAASSAFPPILAPMRLDLSRETVTTPDGARFDDPELHRQPVLVDGGVYDNLGLESVWKRCGVIIASYAGFNPRAEASNFDFDHLYPMVMSMLASGEDWRERVLIGLFENILADKLPERAGVYWTAGTDLQKFPIHDGWKPSLAELNMARDTPTRLEVLSLAEQTIVINAGYAFADAGVRSKLLPDAKPPASAPRIV